MHIFKTQKQSISPRRPRYALSQGFHLIVGPIGCRPYSGFSVSFSFFFFNFGFLLLSTLSGILVCHIAILVRGLKCGDSKPCEQDGIDEMVKARL